MSPEESAAAERAGALLVDIRPEGLRETDGEVPGAIIIDRNQLEWRLAPASEHRIPEVSAEAVVILFCDEGYASSLAAATFYSDSINDLPLLSAVGAPVVVDPDSRLQAEALRRGWPVISLLG